MAAIKLGKRPESFKRKVTFPMVEGSDGVIWCEFKYRTRKEFGGLIDRMAELAGVTPTVDAAVSVGDFMGRTVDKNADYLGEVLVGWDVDAPLDRENIEQLCNELPGATRAIIEAYRAAVVEGHLGN